MGVAREDVDKNAALVVVCLLEFIKDGHFVFLLELELLEVQVGAFFLDLNFVSFLNLLGNRVI